MKIQPDTRQISKHTSGQCNLADKLFWKAVLSAIPPKCGVTWLAKEMRLMTGVERLISTYAHTIVLKLVTCTSNFKNKAMRSTIFF